MNDTQALSYIEACLAERNAVSYGDRVMVLQALSNNSEPNVARLALHMLKYTEQKDYRERFDKFLVKKAAALGVRLHEMRREQVVSAEEEFKAIESLK